MERDNTNYKSEVSSFKELRNNIREQLQEKQDEINGLLGKIDELNDQLSTISSEYETKIIELEMTPKRASKEGCAVGICAVFIPPAPSDGFLIKKIQMYNSQRRSA